MKGFFVILLVSVVVLSCQKKEVQQNVFVEESAVAPYDTTAIDSFDVGANPAILQRQVDSLRKRISDSINAEKLKQEKAQEDLKKKDEAAKKENSEAKKPAAEEKNKPAEVQAQ